MSAAVGLETLTELRAKHASLFYAQTAWWTGEKFMRTLPSDPLPGRPVRLVHRGMVPKKSDLLPSAVDLAHLYVQYPEDSIWESFLWCADVDQYGQRVFIGGVDRVNNHGLQLHRHLSITIRFGVVSWR